ncbi:Non-ous end-joining factor 1 [Thoreauomyces humboldtii]|nr:Non-ous end-joining factor 1 [Thoreauomyces humboldtii]
MSGLENVPWVPFALPTADGTVLSVLVKAHVSDVGYSVLVTDLRRVWQETAGKDILERKLKTYAKSFSESPIGKMLPFIEGFLKSQTAGVKYMSFFEPDESGELRIHATGSVGTVALRWVFECAQIHSNDAEPPRPTPVQLLHDHLGLPLMAIAIEQDRRITALHTLLERKDKELQDCHETLAFHQSKFAPKKTLPFSKDLFKKQADEEFRTPNVEKDQLPKLFLESHEESSLYKIAMARLSNNVQDVSPLTAVEDGGAQVSSADQGATLPIASTHNAFATVDPSVDSQGVVAGHEGVSKKDRERNEEMERQRAREEMTAKQKDKEAQKKKRKKIM